MNISVFSIGAGFHTCRLAMDSRPTLTVLLFAFVLLAACVLLGASPALAVGVDVTDPITNEVGVDLDADIVATYTAAISPTTVTTRTFVAQGMMSGRRDGAFIFSGGDTVVTLDPDDDYFSGEVVRVSATAGVSDTVGSPVDAYQWQFTAGPVLSRCAGEFFDIGAGLTPVKYASAAWGDYDNDGDLDILLTGDAGTFALTANVYRNDGGSFTDINAGLPGVMYGAVAWGDYDNDGDLDILLTGAASSGYISRVYRNNGNGTFTDIGAGLKGVHQGAVAWGDYDNDGDLDIFLSGFAAYYEFFSGFYRNNGNGTFTSIGGVFPGLALGSAAWGDYDNDGDLDLLLTGEQSDYSLISRVYRNNGGGSFSDIGVGLLGVYRGSVAWGDYDSDNDLDILLTGHNISSGSISQVYRNNGNGTFTHATSLTGVIDGSAAWGDYDNDGDLDILLAGDSGAALISRVYRNNGDGSFTDVNAGLTGMHWGSAAWGDYDDDGDLDVLLVGGHSSSLAKVYSNEDCVELAISKEVAPETRVDHHSVVTYTAVLSNTGGSATNVWLTDTLPNQVDFAGWIGDAHGATVVNDEIRWTGAVTGGAALTWTWTATHTSGYGEVVTNTARYSYLTANGSDGAAFRVKTAPDLTITKTIAPEPHVDLGDPVTYTVVLANTGESDANGAAMTDTLPAETDFAGWAGDDHGATVTDDGIRWTGTVTNGTAITWTWAVTQTAERGAIVDNTAWYGYGGQTESDTATFQVFELMRVTTTDPSVNEVAVDLDADIAATFDANVDGSTVTAGTFVAQGMMGGLLTGSFDTTGSTVTLDPDRNLFPNEVVRTSLTRGIRGTEVKRLVPYQWQFTAGPVLDRCAGEFLDIGAGLVGGVYSSAAWGDYDGDGDLDILVAGDTGAWSPFTKIYRNDGNGTFTDINAGLTGVCLGSVAWGDYDNDGDLDILITGLTNGPAGLARIASIHRNNGDDTFTDISAGLIGVHLGSAAWGDYDNDGDLDIVLTGDMNNTPFTRLYRNDGGSFTDLGNAGLMGMTEVSVAWGDYDNDGDLDILFVGRDDSYTQAARLYRNDDGVFTYISDAYLIGADTASVAWGDYDNDGDLDILYAGGGGWMVVARLFRNDGDGAFAYVDAGLTGVYGGSVGWGDYDNDGDLDILLTGATDWSYADPKTLVYRNDGPDGFTLAHSLPDVAPSSSSWGDYDNDGDLDILLTGSGGTRIYRNNNCPKLIKQVSPEEKADYHSVVTYTVVLSDTGGSGTNVILADTLPTEVDFAGWLGDDHGATVVDDEIRWTGTITADEVITWTWQVTHTGGYGEVVTNTAEYTFSLVRKSDDAVFTVKAAPNLTITKSVSPLSGVDEGDVVTYTVMLQNIGETDAVGAAMTDTLPARVGFVGWVEQNGATEAGGAITWAGDVGAGAALTWTWQVTYTGGYGLVDNTAWYSHTVAGAGSAMATFRPALEVYYLPVIYKQSH